MKKVVKTKVKLEVTAQELALLRMALNDRAAKHPELAAALDEIDFKLFRAESAAK